MLARRWLIAGLVIAGLAVWTWLTFLHESSADASFTLIEENLYAGEHVPAPPPETGAVVNLCDQRDPYRIDAHLDVPIDGSTAPSIAWLKRVIAFIDEQRAKGVTVYVHCFGGMNRSGMVVTAYLMHEHGWPRDQALAFAQSKRPQFSPNPTMLRFLAEWEATLKTGKT